jgi:hypothetical protein
MTERKPRVIARLIREARERIVTLARQADSWAVGPQRSEGINRLGYEAHRLGLLEQEYKAAAGKEYTP